MYEEVNKKFLELVINTCFRLAKGDFLPDTERINHEGAAED